MVKVTLWKKINEAVNIMLDDFNGNEKNLHYVNIQINETDKYNKDQIEKLNQSRKKSSTRCVYR